MNNAAALSLLYLNAPKRGVPFALKAAQLEPKNPAILNNTGYLLARAASNALDFEKSVSFLKRAIAIQPDCADAFENLSYTYFQMERFNDAAKAAERATCLNPKSALAYFNWAVAAYKQSQTMRAYRLGKKALALEPNNAFFYNDCAVFARAVGNVQEAVLLIDQAISSEPENLRYRMAPLEIINCIPSDLETLKQSAKRVHDSFVRFYPNAFTYENRQKKEKPARIGFVSGDFRFHVVSFFVENLFLHLENIEIFAFSTTFFEDQKTQDFKKLCKEFVVIAGLDDFEAAKLIHQKDIDVLVDLSGLTVGNRLGVFAQRPAPVQMTWVGWMNTTGCPNMHWILCDETLCPQGSENQFFPEKPYRMPQTWATYFPPENVPEIVLPPVFKKGFITFGAFQNPNKASRWTFDLWAAVLHVNPTARFLWVRPPFADSEFKEKIIEEFTCRGVSAERITLRANAQIVDYFESINETDIVLDTTPCTGGTTTCEALYMGTPVITLAGARMGDRLSATYLKNVGLSDFIADSEESYLAKSLFFAQNPKILAEIRHNLRTTMQQSALMDYKTFARDFQNALNGMWIEFLKNPR